LSSPTVRKLRVLFVDDEESIRSVMGKEIKRMGHDVTLCADGEAALPVIDRNSFDVAIVDLRMNAVSGWDVIAHLREVTPETEFVISTGHGDKDDAVRALREGAYDFLSKPVKLFEVAAVLNRIAEKRSLENKTLALESRLKSVEGSADLVGDSGPMSRVKTLVSKIAPTDSTVLIMGETGTGKELVARRVHDLSLRANAPFVPVNCGALPENLVESEFFGHRKGAYTGAETARKGLFEVANGGTLFLDELGELDKAMQVKLLRFLESGEVRRLGENEPFHVDVRVVCATNRHLEEMVAEGSFREDLYFRVNTFEIHLPPLRERTDDIPSLARHLVARKLKRPVGQCDLVSAAAMELLLEHDWSGNVRELANAIEHAVIMSSGEEILPEHLPASLLRGRARRGDGAGLNLGDARTLREIEMDVILHVLEKHEGDKPSTAAELGIALKTLYNKLNQYEAKKAG
jgi:DNA-binding NtrC family response regulator